MMRFVAMLLAALTAGASQPSTAPTTAESFQRGNFHIQFSQQSALSSVEAQNKRHHIEITPLQRYKLADESFEAYVPQNYDPQKLIGLLIWINAGNSGALPRGWEEICNQRKLIFIGANDVGNARGIGVRIGLALDAAQNLKSIYSIDESRIYAAGVSGGAKVAGAMAMIYPEVFGGAISIVGIGYFRNIPLPDQPNRAYPPMYGKPPGAMFQLARTQRRFVLITGSNDFNRDSIHAIYQQGFVADNFAHVQYSEITGFGHGLPEPAEISRAMEFLDAPLAEIVASQMDQAERLSKAGKLAEAMAIYSQAVLHGSDVTAARAKQQIEILNKKIAAKIPATRPATAKASP